MAESELITQDDIDDIGAVLQLAPHHKNTTFTTVTKTEEGELVSLDELYEKTGQESINTFLKGFDLILSSNKIGKNHGLALNIEGAEKWMELPDTFNSLQGKESFFKAIKNGISTVIKAIIKFITGVCNWISIRIKSLLGWGQTVKETKFLHERSAEIKGRTKAILNTMGVHVSDEFFETIPNGLTLTETFTVTKERIVKNETAFKRLEKTAEYIKDYQETFNKWTSEIRGSKREFDRLMIGLRNKVRSNRLTVSDVVDFTQSIHEINIKYTDKRKVFEYLNGLAKVLYNIEFKDLGSDINFKELEEEVKKKAEEVKISYNPNYANELARVTRLIYQRTFSEGKGSQLIQDSTIKELKNIINVKDGEFIQEIERNHPEFELSGTYLKFSNDISAYAAGLELSLRLVQKVEISITNMVRWKDKVSNMLSAYILNDAVKILEANQKYLSVEERKVLEKTFKTGRFITNEKGEQVEELETITAGTDHTQDAFFDKYVDEPLLERMSETFADLQRDPKFKILLNNWERFKNQLKGK